MAVYGFVGEGGQSPAAYYRAILPAAGVDAVSEHTAWVAPAVTSKPSGPLWGLTRGPDGEPAGLEAHAIVLRCWTRPSMADMIRDARANGQVVLLDVDDDVWHWPASNPAARASNEDRAAGRTVDPDVMVENMRACDGVLASTPSIAETIRDLVDTPVHVCRSGIDPDPFEDVWEARTSTTVEGPVRVGWFGTLDYRADDFDLAAPAVQNAVESGARFVWLGCDSAAALRAFEDRWPAIAARMTVVPWSPLEQLPLLASMVDVAVMPAVDNRFNRGRSHQLALSLAAAGVLPVASHLPEYRELPWVPLRDGSAPWSPHALAALLDDRAKRARLVEQGRHFAIEDGHYLVRAHQWVEAIEGTSRDRPRRGLRAHR